MNEYMCRNYIAEKILSDMSLSRIKRRLQAEAVKSSTLNTPLQQKLALTNHLLDDEGSSNYKDWLSK